MSKAACSLKLALGVTVAVLVLSLVPAVQAQTTWYVDDDAPNDPGPGDPTISDPDEDGSPEHPFDAIQEGIDAQCSGEVVVCDGVYAGPGNKNLDFGGKAITVRSENGPDNCIIDCQNDGRGFYFHSREGPSSVVDGFTIRNSSAPAGGGILCDGYSSPTISNCKISGNSADYTRGGGIYCDWSSSPTISNCEISRNSAASYGGGICCVSSSPTIANCTIVLRTPPQLDRC